MLRATTPASTTVLAMKSTAVVKNAGTTISRKPASAGARAMKMTPATNVEST